MPGLSQVPSCHNRRALNQNGLLQFTRHVHLRKRDFINDVLGFLEFLTKVINGRKHVVFLSSARILREDGISTEKLGPDGRNWGSGAEILGISKASNGCKARILGISGANLDAQVSKIWQEREWLLRA